MAPRGGKICAVAECPSNSTVNKDLSFHRFPVDEKLRKEWVRKCQRKDKFNPNTSRICSRHFNHSDFVRDLRAELLGTSAKHVLIAGAVPSLYLRENVLYIPSARSDRYQEKKLKEEHRSTVEEAMTEVIPNSSTSNNKPILVPQDYFASEVAERMPPEMPAAATEEVCQDDAGLKHEVISHLLQENKELKKEIEKLKNDLTMAETTGKEHFDLLSSVFSKNEIELLSKKKKSVRWSNDEIRNAFTLRYLSRRAYVYLRQTRGFPFPGISTLRRWASMLNLRSGILHDVLKMMKIASPDKTTIEKLCVLSFDEMKVLETLEYDERDDCVVGPHRQMQVALVRSLTGKWKQPVFVAFDTKMTVEILKNIISEIHCSGYKVVAVVSDCGGGNIGLWEKLGISLEMPFFNHPVTNDTIVYIPDVPHLLKLLRNWFLDTGFCLKDGTMISKEPVQELLKIVSTEVTVCPKLKETHLTCQKSQRQSVSLAAQLMSHTVGTALTRFTPGDSKLALDTGNFILLINRWFDVMNVRSVSRSTASKSPFGVFLNEQINVLDEVCEVVEGMRCRGKESLMTFQKGILMASRGLKVLFERVKNDGVEYILTCKINQDALENLFGQVRAKGGLYDHPSPLAAIYRLRAILLGKNPGLVNSNANVTMQTDGDEEETFILADVLKRAEVVPDIHAANIVPHIPEATSVPVPCDEAILSSSSSETSSSETSSLASETTREEKKEEASRDGLSYIAGWLSYKFKSKYPELTETQERHPDHSYSLPPWISQLSLGGLTNPSKKFLREVFKMEEYFLRLIVSEGKDFLKQKGIVKKITLTLSKKNNIKQLPLEIIKRFVKLRVIIRMRFLLHSEGDLSRKRKFACRLKEMCKKKKIST